MRYPIICFEGPDGVGKSYQVRAVAAQLGARIVRQPYASTVYETHIKPILTSEAPYDPYYLQLLMAVARYEGMAKSLELAKESPVIQDRGIVSGYCYASGELLSHSWNNAITGKEPKPDLVIVILGRQFSRDDNPHKYDLRPGWFETMTRVFEGVMKSNPLDLEMIRVDNCRYGQDYTKEEMTIRIEKAIKAFDFSRKGLLNTWEINPAPTT